MSDSVSSSSALSPSLPLALPSELSGWAVLAEHAGFQNWEQVVSGFIQDCPGGSQELFNFLQKQRKEAEEKKREESASKVSHVEECGGQSEGSQKRESSESNAKANSATAKQRINIGGTSAKEGWLIFNALQLPCVDVVGLSSDLSHWEGNSVEEVYSRSAPLAAGSTRHAMRGADVAYGRASHCFEHLGYQKELMVSLKEVLRVLVPGGVFKVLCSLYLRAPPEDPAFTRFAIMRMIFGGQMDAYDFHKVGFDFATLRLFLLEAGFHSVVQVPSFDLFQDTSSLVRPDPNHQV